MKYILVNVLYENNNTTLIGKRIGTRKMVKTFSENLIV